jgi:hypothetical protein
MFVYHIYLNISKIFTTNLAPQNQAWEPLSSNGLSQNADMLLYLIKYVLPVTPVGGNTTRPNSPYFMNICPISATDVLAGKFFARIIVLDLCFGV